jgi:hypothetical protein
LAQPNTAISTGPYRFYLGELPVGNGGWIPTRHQAVPDPELFDRV